MARVERNFAELFYCKRLVVIHILRSTSSRRSKLKKALQYFQELAKFIIAIIQSALKDPKHDIIYNHKQMPRRSGGFNHSYYAIIKKFFPWPIGSFKWRYRSVTLSLHQCKAVETIKNGRFWIICSGGPRWKHDLLYKDQRMRGMRYPIEDYKQRAPLKRNWHLMVPQMRLKRLV